MNIEVAPKETEIKADWYNAVLYCQFLDVGGKTDWRLPTKDELNDIYNLKNKELDGSIYWSATGVIYSNYAWTQHITSGIRVDGHKDNHFYVRAVRDIK